ncbi:MAG: hypothetical protein WD845_05585 [Pirellulales bacterium]
MNMIRMWAAALAAAVGLTSTLAAADPRELFLARVPANVCLAVYTGDAAATCEAFQKTTIGQKLTGPVFAPLLAALAQGDRGSLLRMKPIFGFDWSDLAGTHDPGGVIVMPLHDESFGIAWLFAADKSPTEVPPCLAAASEYFKGKGYEVVTDQHPIAELTLFTNPKEEDSEWTPVMFRADKFYGIAASPATAAALLEAHGHPSLGMPPELGEQPAAIGTGNPANVSFFLRPFELLELLQARDTARSEQEKDPLQQPADGAKQAAAEEEPKESTLEAADRMGFTALKGIAGSIHFDAAEPCEWSVEAALLTERPYQGALRSLELRPGPLPPLPAWVPADVDSAAVWRWDFPLAMQGFGALYDQANEPGPDGEGLFDDVLDGLRDDPEGVQVDLRRDLFEQLGPEILEISDDRGSAAAGPDGQPVDTQRLLYVATVRDAAKVADALTRFYKGDDRVTRDTWGKYDIWTVGENASLFVEGESDSLVTVRGIALGEGQLLFSTDVELLRSAALPADSGASKLTDDPAWQQLLGWCKSKTTNATALESLVRLDRVAEASYQAAITPPPTEAAAIENDTVTPADDDAAEAEAAEPPVARLWRLMLFGASQADAKMPFGAAPPFQQLQDALTRGGVVLSETADGWLVQFGAMAGQR